MVEENCKYKKDHEESLIGKSFTLGFFNSYLGMTYAAFVTRSYTAIASLLLTVCILKQLILNLIDFCSPVKKWSKIKKAHKS